MNSMTFLIKMGSPLIKNLIVINYDYLLIFCLFIIVLEGNSIKELKVKMVFIQKLVLPKRDTIRCPSDTMKWPDHLMEMLNALMYLYLKELVQPACCSISVPFFCAILLVFM